MMLGRLGRVGLGMSSMTFRCIRVMGRGFMFARFVVLRCFMVVLGSCFMVVRCLFVVIGAFMVSHRCLSVLMYRQRNVGKASSCSTRLSLSCGSWIRLEEICMTLFGASVWLPVGIAELGEPLQGAALICPMPSTSLPLLGAKPTLRAGASPAGPPTPAAVSDPT
jgi:hypothetical protein